MKVPSVSKLQTGIACPGSVSLPWVAEEKSGTGVASDGIKLHAVIDILYQNGKEAAEEKAKELGCHGEFLLIPSSLFIPLDDFQTEVVFDYNLATGESCIYGRVDPKDHPRKEKGIWTRGVADLIGWKDGLLHVVDWKTGFGSAPSPAQNWQLITTALAFRRSGTDAANARIVKTRSPEPDIGDFSAEFLEQKQTELSDFAKLISSPEHKTRFKTGEHCKFCSSWVFCPAQTTAIQRCVGIQKFLPSNIDDKQVEEAVLQIKEMDDLAVKAKKKIREYIELNGNEFKMSDGTILIPGKTPGQYRRK